MSRNTRRKLLNNLNSVSNISTDVNHHISGSQFSPEASYSSKAEEDMLFDIKMRSHGYVLTPAGWFPAHMVKEPVIIQCKNFIKEVPGAVPVIFRIINPNALQVNKLAFEIAFILSVDRVINELIYPVHDVVCHLVTRPFSYSDICDKPIRTKTKVEYRLQLIKGGIELNPGPKGKPPKVNRKPRARYRPRAMHGAQTQVVAKPIMVNRPRRFMVGMPSSFYIRLTYVIPFQQVVGGGTTNSLRFTSNAYDVDTAFGSTAMAYFSALASIYSRFRTLRLGHNFDVSNQEAFPIQLIWGFSTASIGSTALGANYAENRFFHTSILSPINGSRSTQKLIGSLTAETLFGSVQAVTDDLFTGSTTSSTLSSSATMNCYVGGISAAVPVNGFFVGGSITLDLELIRRNDLIG